MIVFKHLPRNLRSDKKPDYFPMTERVEKTTCAAPPAAGHPSILVGAASLEPEIFDPRSVRAALDLYARLEPDAYTDYLARFYREGTEKFGASWRYADIVTVLIALARVLEPKNYLEIGVRRGRSACAAASSAPKASFALFDRWVERYAGMENPGQALVRAELAKVGHRGTLEFVDGDSHKTLKEYFEKNPRAAFDLVTVDGDHSAAGASEDLRDVLPRVKIGGAVVFDDISHPQHAYLRGVWKTLVEDDARWSSWTFEGAGFGVAFALRRF